MVNFDVGHLPMHLPMVSMHVRLFLPERLYYAKQIRPGNKKGLIFDLEGNTVFCCFIGQNSFKLLKLGVFWNPQELLLLMGTEILKIDDFQQILQTSNQISSDSRVHVVLRNLHMNLHRTVL